MNPANVEFLLKWVPWAAAAVTIILGVRKFFQERKEREAKTQRDAGAHEEWRTHVNQKLGECATDRDYLKHRDAIYEERTKNL